ncbi:MAG TPA: sulfotransferase family protein, partial [Proteobacteria bacterium]|nr:sulfotransferase family protein [Pseudomonadota bacterium]
GEYEAAFAAFTAANRAMASTFDPRRVDVDAIFKQIDQSRAWFTAERVAGWRGDEPADDTPSPVFLVGFPRSGTTLTEQLLASVGGVVVS